MNKIIYFLVLLFGFGTNIYALNNIKINDNNLSPLFDKDIFVYNYFTNEDSIIISVVKDEGEKVSGYGNFIIYEGENNFIITSEKENKKLLYKINVFKNYAVFKEEDNSLLKTLSISGYDIDFIPEVFSYEIKISDEEYLDINYDTFCEDVNVKIVGNSNFNKSENLIKINTNINEKESEYVIYVLKDNVVSTSGVINDVKREFNDTYKYISIVSITLVLSLLCLFIFYLFFLKKKKA